MLGLLKSYFPRPTDLSAGFSEPVADASADSSGGTEHGCDEAREGGSVAGAPLNASQRRGLAGGGSVGRLPEFWESASLRLGPGIAGVADGGSWVGNCRNEKYYKVAY